jgi:hypothetical protein
VTSLTVSGLAPNTTYTFQVGARNTAGTKYSVYFSGRTAALPPPPPTSYNPCPSGCGVRSTANSMLVAAELSRTGDGYGEMRARSNSLGGWESFVFVGDCASAAGCAIKNTLNGLYVSAEISRTGDGYGTLRARSSSIGTWQLFGLVGNCSVAPGCAIRSKANGLYVSAEISRTGDGYGTLRARSSSIGGWERYLTVALPAPPPPPTSWAYTITGAYGANVRVAPYTTAQIVTTLAKGSTIRIVCQTVGDRFGAGSYPDNRTWDKLTDGNFVHDNLTSTPGGVRENLATGGYAFWTPGIPRC